MGLPAFHTPADVAAKAGWSERKLRERARELGACHVLGKTMVLTDDDVRTILEATKCPSTSTAAEKSGTTGARLPEGNYEALRAQRARKPPTASSQNSKRASGKVISMDQRRS